MIFYLISSLLLCSFIAYILGWRIGREIGFKAGLFVGQDTFAAIMMEPKLRDLCIKMADRKIPIEDLQKEILKAMQGE